MNMDNKRKKLDEKILELLYRSFDDDLSQKERDCLKKALEDSEELRLERAKIIEQRQAISGSAAPSFKPYFVEKVMQRIDSLSDKNGLEKFYETFKVMFRRFAIAGAVILIALVIYNLRIGENISSEEIFYASDVTIEEILELPLF
jgi:hypothetical protein